jgi:CRP/FNR family transcriptional regulator, cyclic AMP receptor protein
VTATAPIAMPRRIGRVRLVDIEPDLSRHHAVDGNAARATIAVMELPAGTTSATTDGFVGHRRSLVLKGLLVRDVDAAGHSIAELLGPGDVLTSDEAEDQLVPTNVEWHALERTLIADLASVDGADSHTEAALLDNVARRLEAQVARGCVRCAITSLIRVDLRLLAYLWYLASSFGVVTAEGVRLDLPLTHALLAQLIGARRPTVTTAFGTLTDDGYIRRNGRSILLVGDRPSALEKATTD